MQEAAITALGLMEAKQAAAPLKDILQAAKSDLRKVILDTLMGKAGIAKEETANPFGGGKKKKETPIQVKKAAALALSRILPEVAVDPMI